MKVLRPSLTLFLLAVVAVSAFSEEIEAVQKRMAKRLPVVNEMKTRGEVGEDNRGFLEILKKDAADGRVVQEENADRRAVYEDIARETGTTAELVGEQRARQIAKRSTAGIMLQDAQGRWYKKGATGEK